MSHPVRGAWIEMIRKSRNRCCSQSHPVRGAWIEMVFSSSLNLSIAVAPREGCVD